MFLVFSGSPVMKSSLTSNYLFRVPAGRYSRGASPIDW
jgi:hypothetical protein